MPLYLLIGGSALLTGAVAGFIGGRGVAGTGNIIKWTVIGAGAVVGARALKVI